MTPVAVSAKEAPALAAVHGQAFPAPWNAAAIAGLLDAPGAFALACRDGAGWVGFILMRAVAGEAEVLTLAVAPERRRRGHGQALLAAGLDQAAAAGAQSVFLEVAHDNAAAIALYGRSGFQPAGRRPAYYARGPSAPADALILRRALPTTTLNRPAP